MRRTFSTLATIAGLASSVLGCSDSPTSPAGPAVAGSYIAAVPSAGNTLGTVLFTTTQNGVTTDHVAAGAEVRLVLNANGTTTGRLLIPGVPDGEGGTIAFDEDLSGAWTLSGQLLQLDHDADTFLRDMPFTVTGNQLVGDRTFGDVRVRLTLVRQ